MRPVAIYGKALGGGCEIVLACDLVVAAGDTYMTVAGRQHPIDTCLAALEIQATVARMTYPESRRSAMRMRTRERMHRHG